MRACVLLLISIAAVSGNIFEDGIEYKFKTECAAGSGTMDHAPHVSGFSYRYMTRIQVHGNTLSVAISDLSYSEFNGKHTPAHWPFDKTTFETLDRNVPPFSVELDADGLFSSLKMPPKLTLNQRNMVKGWAQRLQLNLGKIRHHEHGFTSDEHTIFGDCETLYAVTDHTIIKSVSHTRDCKNRAYVLVDDWRGHRFDIDHEHHDRREKPDGIFSSGETVFKGEMKGDVFVPKVIVGSSSVAAQFFGSEGLSFYTHSNSTSILVESGPSSADIIAVGFDTKDLKYEFEDQEYSWKTDRDLKAREEHLSTGEFFEDDQETIKKYVEERFSTLKSVVSKLSADKDTIAKAHNFGINTITPLMLALNYNSLKALFDEFAADKSEEGIFKLNMFNELLGSLGSSASAMLVRDLLIENKFDNYRDAVRILTSVPFHIRHPNTQLLREYESLNSHDELHYLVKEALPLVLSHLARITCARAGEYHSPASKECFDTVVSKHVDKYIEKILASDDHEEQARNIVYLKNLEHGGIAEKLKPLIYGETKVKCGHLRTIACFAASYDVMATGHGADYYLPVFANKENSHELRIAAAELILMNHPTVTHLNAMVAIVYSEKDYEVINYIFTLFEKYAHSIDPAHKHNKDLTQYFLKYMKQYSQFETDYGFGVSKTYVRQFQQRKYGYGGSYRYYVVGSHKSTMPLCLGMGVSSNFFGAYHAEIFGVHLRIEGLSKALVRKFKKMDPAVWKTEDLKNILLSDMNIRAHPDQPIRIEVAFEVKDTVVAFRQYDETSTRPGGNLKSLYEDLMNLGDTYSINHQRALRMGSLLYQQPTEVGIPVTYINSFTGALDLHATVKKGNQRGLLFRNVDYKMNFFGQASRLMMIQHPYRKTSFGILQDRIYGLHAPRTFTVGVNLLKKEFKMSLSRPPYEDPVMMLMHSQVMVFTRGQSVQSKRDISAHCPDCKSRTIVSAGPDAAKERVFVDRENEAFGSYLHGQYFDCEMDVNRGRTTYHLLRAFMPYNKNPMTFGNGIRMGIRQIRAYLSLFPRVEKCGSYIRWSQSKKNPVNEVELSVRVNYEPNGEKLFFRGRKWHVKAMIKMKGEPKERAIRVNMAYEFTPGYIQNNFKFVMERAELPGIMKPYITCFNLESKYPDFTHEFMDYDMSSPMEVTGKARIRAGVAENCDAAPGEIAINFKHETTQEARENLKHTWYYHQCQKDKTIPSWAHREGKDPMTEACYMTAWDATTARKYSWNMDFVKMSPRMKNYISQFQSVIKAGLLPYWDIDPETLSASNPDPHMKIDATFKDHDKSLDMFMETSQGGQHFHDIPLSLNWYPRFRNLKFTSTIKRLMNYKIISPCVVTSDTIHTLDNVTYTYTPTSCWTLTSGHCSPHPSYAIFTKKSSGLPLAAKIYIGGHSIEFKPSGPKKIEVLINGESTVVGEKEHEHSVGGTEIFKILKWGSTYNVYSFLKMWVVYDGHALSVIPAPSIKGQHCGLCGNYNRNQYDEFESKESTHLSTADELVENYKWKC